MTLYLGAVIFTCETTLAESPRVREDYFDRIAAREKGERKGEVWSWKLGVLFSFFSVSSQTNIGKDKIKTTIATFGRKPLVSTYFLPTS